MMKNNQMMISFSKNSSPPDTKFVSSLDLHLSSSSQDHHHIPHSTVNQTLEHFPLATPPSKKPRGRPKGSKNKPKCVPQPTDPTGNSIVVKVPPRGNVMKYIIDVARRGQFCVTILNATGNVTSVTLRHTPCGLPALTLHGSFTLISLNGSYIHKNEYTLHSGATPPSGLFFGINLCTSQGEFYGGAVSGKIVAGTGGIQVELSTFKNPSIYKQVIESKEINENNNNNASNFNGVGNSFVHNFF